MLRALGIRPKFHSRPMTRALLVTPNLGDTARCHCGWAKVITKIEERIESNTTTSTRRVTWSCPMCGELESDWVVVDKRG